MAMEPRSHTADGRDVTADERDAIADRRDRMADSRDDSADARDAESVTLVTRNVRDFRSVPGLKVEALRGGVAS